MVNIKWLRHVGYGFGDMSSSMFWKVFSYYLPFFYSNIFGLSLKDAGIILLVTRIWDAVSDPMMGILADRTNTRWGKYRPYLLFVAPLFSIAGILLFTTPDWGYSAKLVWAYVTYILMMTIYTGINVPYGAMLGVMTDDSQEKTVYSSFRMFFAYGGSFLALFLWEPLCNALGGYDNPQGWFWAMVVIASACFLLWNSKRSAQFPLVRISNRCYLTNPGGCLLARRSVSIFSVLFVGLLWLITSPTSFLPRHV